MKLLQSILVYLEIHNWIAPMAERSQSGSDFEEEDGVDDMAEIRA